MRDVELEAIAQTWSEHCKHKIFNAKITVKDGKKKKIVNSLFKTYIRGATEKLMKKKKWLLSVFSDNAGIFEFVEGWNVAMKVEPTTLLPRLIRSAARLPDTWREPDILGSGLAQNRSLTPMCSALQIRITKGKYRRGSSTRKGSGGVRAGVAAEGC